MKVVSHTTEPDAIEFVLIKLILADIACVLNLHGHYSSSAIADLTKITLRSHPIFRANPALTPRYPCSGPLTVLTVE